MTKHIFFRNRFDVVKFRIKFNPFENTLTDVFIAKVHEDAYRIQSSILYAEETVATTAELEEYLFQVFSEWPSQDDANSSSFASWYVKDVIVALDLLFGGSVPDAEGIRTISHDLLPPEPEDEDDGPRP